MISKFFMENIKQIFAMLRPDGKGYQISYETENSRKLHQFVKPVFTFEKMPHGAGSFHDPEQHYTLMRRIEDYVKAHKNE